MAEKIDKDDKLTDSNTIINEQDNNYYSDIYTPWETKEQLVIWWEVQTPWVFTWEIDTSTITTTTDNIYNLSVDNPDGKIFSIRIAWWGISQEKTFKIWFFNNTPLAYSTLETELQTWLWDAYIVEYVSWTNYSIQRLDKQEITKTNPSLVRDITISNYNTAITKLDIIVDWVTVTLEWTLWGLTSAEYLKSQLSSSIYYMTNDTSNVLTIARKDWAIPVITQTNYNRYTYLVKSERNDTIQNPNSSSLWWSWGTTKVKTYEYKTNIDWVDYGHFVSSWLTWSNATYNYFAANIADISDDNTYSNWAVLLDRVYSSLLAWYSKSTINWPYGTFNNEYDFTYNRTDFLQSTISYGSRYVLDSGLSLVTYNTVTFNVTETNHVASIAVTTHTEISITLSIDSNNYFISVPISYSRISLSAISSNWSSEWIYELRSQKCTAKYWSTTINVSWEIFRTDANNYWNIVSVKRWWFVINFTTNTSNKLNFTCS